MKHQKIKELLSAYFDGELPDKERQEVEQHLTTCQECQKELVDLEELEKLSKQFQYSYQDEEYWQSYPGRVITGIKQKITPTPDKEEKMFKDSFIEGGKNYGTKAMIFPLSLLAHAAIATLLVIMPLLNTGNLPNVEVLSLIHI